MTAVKQSPEETLARDLRVNHDRKSASLKAFEESDGSSSEDAETYSPKSVVLRRRKVPAAVKNVNVDIFGRRVRNQIERVRAEDLHLGEGIGECLIVKICGAGDQDVMVFSRPASPLSGGDGAGRMKIGP